MSRSKVIENSCVKICTFILKYTIHHREQKGNLLNRFGLRAQGSCLTHAANHIQPHRIQANKYLQYNLMAAP